MKLTLEQQAAVQDNGNVCLVSCPGSGKTRTVVAKLMRCIDEVRGSTRRVACITHTNAAADEIFARIRDLSASEDQLYFDVATIHSFALRHVLTPFGHLLPEFRDGFRVITSEEDEFAAKVAELVAAHALHRDALQEFDQIQRGPNGALGQLEAIPQAVQQLWCDWLDQNAMTTLGDIVFHAGRLMAMPHISSAVASRFAWLLVDEFQDSSPGQTSLLTQIYSLQRTRFFCVGDPFQAIYGFAGATPDGMARFAAAIGANAGYRLTGNFRSSAEICRSVDRLRTDDPPMQAVGEHAAWPAAPTHVRVATPPDGIFDHFLPGAAALNVPLGEVAILASSWFALVPIARALRARGIPAIGPGARPYRRQHLIGHLLEPIGAYLESPEPGIAIEVQRALFFVVLVLSDRTTYVPWSFRTRVAVCRMLDAAATARRTTNRAVDWIAEVTDRITNVLVDAEVLQREAADVLVQSAAEMNADILERDGGGDLTVGDLGVFARPTHCVQLMTVHKAKGREFEAVAVIEAHDGKFPHFSVARIADPVVRASRVAEGRRVFYVASTRAKRMLMFVTDTRLRAGRYPNTPSPFLVEMGLVADDADDDQPF